MRWNPKLQLRIGEAYFSVVEFWNRDNRWIVEFWLTETWGSVGAESDVLPTNRSLGTIKERSGHDQYFYSSLPLQNVFVLTSVSC